MFLARHADGVGGEGWVEVTELNGTLPGVSPQEQDSTQARATARTPRSNETERSAVCELV